MKEKLNTERQSLSGALVFAGTTIPIKVLFDYLEAGETINDFLNDFRSVNKEQVEMLLQVVTPDYPLKTGVEPKIFFSNPFSF